MANDLVKPIAKKMREVIRCKGVSVRHAALQLGVPARYLRLVLSARIPPDPELTNRFLRWAVERAVYYKAPTLQTIIKKDTRRAWSKMRWRMPKELRARLFERSRVWNIPQEVLIHVAIERLLDNDAVIGTWAEAIKRTKLLLATQLLNENPELSKLLELDLNLVEFIDKNKWDHPKDRVLQQGPLPKDGIDTVVVGNGGPAIAAWLPDTSELDDEV